MSEYSAAREKSDRPLLRWDTKVLLALFGCLLFGEGINSLLDIVRHFASDPESVSFMDNWLVWVAVLSFLSGWLFAHGIEIAVLQKQIGTTRVLIIFLFLFLFIIPQVVSGFGSSPLFQSLENVRDFAFSGFFFRYSMYQAESLRGWPDVVFGKK